MLFPSVGKTDPQSGDRKGEGNLQILYIMQHSIRPGWYLLNTQDFVQDLSGGANFNFHGLILLLSPKCFCIYLYMAMKHFLKHLATWKTVRNYLLVCLHHLIIMCRYKMKEGVICPNSQTLLRASYAQLVTNGSYKGCSQPARDQLWRAPQHPYHHKLLHSHFSVLGEGGEALKVQWKNIKTVIHCSHHTAMQYKLNQVKWDHFQNTS